MIGGAAHFGAARQLGGTMGVRALPITLLYAGILGVFLALISIRITMYRAKYKINFGDGGKEEVQRAIRVQGNFVEYVPLALILIGLLEMNGVPAWSIHGLGVVLVVARLLHAYSLYAGAMPPRVVGTSGTWAVLVVAGLWSVARSLGVA